MWTEVKIKPNERSKMANFLAEYAKQSTLKAQLPNQTKVQNDGAFTYYTDTAPMNYST